MIAVVVLAGCATTRGAPPVRAALNEEFRIPAGQTAEVEELRVRFIRVTEDSRCPINARCIRAGAAKVEVELRARNAAAERVILSTPDEPKGATYGPYDVEVLDLQPGREIVPEGSAVPAPRFEVALRVRRRERPGD
jgi:hypothetical protein